MYGESDNFSLKGVFFLVNVFLFFSFVNYLTPVIDDPILGDSQKNTQLAHHELL